MYGCVKSYDGHAHTWSRHDESNVSAISLTFSLPLDDSALYILQPALETEGFKEPGQEKNENTYLHFSKRPRLAVCAADQDDFIFNSLLQAYSARACHKKPILSVQGSR